MGCAVGRERHDLLGVITSLNVVLGAQIPLNLLEF